jgi:hypothetical protein
MLFMKYYLLAVILFVQSCSYAQTPAFVYYESSGHPKALGLDFKIKYPSSWIPQEGNRPHIVQKFIDESSPSLPTILVLIRKLDYVMKNSEIDVEFSTDNLKKSLPPNCRYVTSQNKLLVDGVRTASADYIVTRTAESSTIGVEAQIYNRAYTMFWQKYMIQIQCSVSQRGIDDNTIKETFAAYRTLFAVLANSFILSSKW